MILKHGGLRELFPFCFHAVYEVCNMGEKEDETRIIGACRIL